MHSCKLPHFFALSLVEAFVRGNDRKRQSNMPINTGATLPHGELRFRIVDDGDCEIQEFAHFPQADTLVSRAGANLDSCVAQPVDCIACYGVLRCWRTPQRRSGGPLPTRVRSAASFRREGG